MVDVTTFLLRFGPDLPLAIHKKSFFSTKWLTDRVSFEKLEGYYRF